ncbi:aminotransferase-like domain-containing protein [Kiloniella sp. b19]|uniref:aminotransferase-like domain-containing protein n=1 Tax=Kiloniella sp. GXU_MW_B19 TaxID=3141326 RepID=UPI0031E41DED
MVPLMSVRRLSAPLLQVSLDRDGAVSLQQQLYDQIRDLILGGRLAPGERLSSSRELSRELDCSRNTVQGAFDQLLAEGYLEGIHGSGTYVSSTLPEDLGQMGGLSGTSGFVSRHAGPLSSAQEQPVTGRKPGEGLSDRGRLFTSFEKSLEPYFPAFTMGPDSEAFPFDLWARVMAKSWRVPDRDLLYNPDPCGYIPLRKAIADHLRIARGLVCNWRQVMITSGSQQAVTLMAQFLLDPGDEVWFEDPGYPGIRGPLLASGVTPVHVPVDEEGLSVKIGREKALNARMAVVAPSHQYPLGTVMSLTRRLELLDWAEEQGSWIFEDDYDSEFRYTGKPLSSLQGLEAERRAQSLGAKRFRDSEDLANQLKAGGRVIYLGSFTKALFPAIRLGYVVVPDDLVDMVAKARVSVEDRTSLVAQPALARFMAEGHFAAHIRRMRRIYGQKQKTLIESLQRHCRDYLEIRPDEVGLHLVCDFKPSLKKSGLRDTELAARANSFDLSLRPLSVFYEEIKPVRQGLLLGYGSCPEKIIDQSVQRLKSLIETVGQ